MKERGQHLEAVSRTLSGDNMRDSIAVTEGLD